MTFQPKKAKLATWMCRASALGKIIPAKEVMTESIKTFLQEKYSEMKWGVEKEISSKYFEKGTACEQKAIDMLNKQLFPNTFITSYKQKVANEYIIGTPDVVLEDYVIDIKNAYDVFTFDKAKLTHDYEWQVKAYLWLTGRTQGFVFYALVDMPDHMLADEERKLFYAGKFMSYESEDYQEAVQELHKKYTYAEIDPVERFKLFPVSLTTEDIEKMQYWVENARTYIDKLRAADIGNKTRNFDLIHGSKALNDLFK